MVAHGRMIEWKGYEETFWVIEKSSFLIKVVVYMVTYVFVELTDFRNLNLRT